MKIMKLLFAASILAVIGWLLGLLLISSGYILVLIFEPFILLFCFALSYGFWQEDVSDEIKNDIFHSRFYFLAIILWPFIFFINCVNELRVNKK
jgi:hypothetical protein